MDLVEVVDLCGSGLHRITDLFRRRVCRAKTRSDRSEKRLRNQFKDCTSTRIEPCTCVGFASLVPRIPVSSPPLHGRTQGLLARCRDWFPVAICELYWDPPFIPAMGFRDGNRLDQGLLHQPSFVAAVGRNHLERLLLSEGQLNVEAAAGGCRSGPRMD